MNLMTVFLQAPAAAPGGGSMMWILLIAMFAIMYFFMIRPQNKKQKEIAKRQLEEAKQRLDYMEKKAKLYRKIIENKNNTFGLFYPNILEME